MSKKQRLELTWIGKDEHPRAEPRILLEEPSKSHHAARRQDNSEVFENLVILGDNLLALSALMHGFEGKIGCIYIDPPYNTGSAFLNYDDGVEHSLWLTHIRDRLEKLWRLLRSDGGVLLISINDDECHYLKVLCDELFGRAAFKSCAIWNTEGNTDNQAKVIRYHEYVLIYCKGELPSLGVVDPNVLQESKLKKERRLMHERPVRLNVVYKTGTRI
jgi:adenine-specific DNA-methyltransferase